jgi:hypothetical protein
VRAFGLAKTGRVLAQNAVFADGRPAGAFLAVTMKMRGHSKPFEADEVQFGSKLTKNNVEG